MLAIGYADVEKAVHRYPNAEINPIGDWTGGHNVDSGATNRKLGSDMADSVTGGGLHGKDLSKADVSVNIYAFLKAQKENKVSMMKLEFIEEEIASLILQMKMFIH